MCSRGRYMHDARASGWSHNILQRQKQVKKYFFHILLYSIMWWSAEEAQQQSLDIYTQSTHREYTSEYTAVVV